MSLILEALRKSEAERRRGRMPDLHAELPPVPAPRAAARPAWPWVAGSGLLVALALAAWLLLGARTEATAVPAALATPRTVVPAAHAPALPRIAHLQPAPVPAPVRTTPTPTPSAAAPVASTPAVPLPSPPAAPRPLAVQTTVATATPPPVERALPPPRPASTAASGGTALMLADLAPEQRKALPPLKLSMHMWNDDASRRFVILDGNRLGEGDRIGDAVVTAITRDGVQLDWNGVALKIPLR